MTESKNSRWNDAEYELELFGQLPFVIQRDVFVVRDVRPLYCWPLQDVPRTRYDNWEPGTKPQWVIDQEKREAEEALALLLRTTMTPSLGSSPGKGDGGESAEGDDDESAEYEEEGSSVAKQSVP